MEFIKTKILRRPSKLKTRPEILGLGRSMSELHTTR